MTTLVLSRDGRHYTTLKDCSAEDARRWSEEGYTVFQVAARGRDWAVLHVGSGKVFSSADGVRAAQDAEFVQPDQKLLPKKGD